MKKNKILNNQKGFTLNELLIVMTIVIAVALYFFIK